MVRLERGDYEELKNKETEFIKIKDENHLLKTKIKKLQNSALERLVHQKSVRHGLMSVNFWKIRESNVFYWESSVILKIVPMSTVQNWTVGVH